MEFVNILTYISGLCIIFVLCRIFIVPLKIMFRLLLNSLIGVIIIFIINAIGNLFAFHIGLNFFTIIFVSILGIPGSLLLITLSIFIV